MGRSDRLRLKDLRAGYRLIGECRELGKDANAWRMHMLDGLRRLTGAQLALYMQMRDLGTVDESICEPLDAGFMEPQHRALWGHYQQERSHLDDPFHQHYFRQFSAGLRTRNLFAVVEWRQWRASRHYNNYIRACKLHDRITTSWVMPHTSPALVQVIVLHRSAADGEYSRRSLRLVHLFHHELTASVGRQLVLPGGECSPALPLQLQRVLACVLRGQNEKQIANRLDLSRHTVNRHMQRLYRHFGVGSRSELMFCCRDMFDRLRIDP